MKDIYIYQHLGMGDHIVCNGLIRELYKQYEKIYFFVKPEYVESVSFMYRDLPNMTYIAGTDAQIQQYLKTNTLPLLKIGHENLNTEMTFDKSFYWQCKVPFANRWTSFYVQRDSQREETLFKQFTTGQPYILIHEDPSRGFILNRDYFANKTLPIIEIKPNLTNNVFDYNLLIENATEFHCIETVFMFIADSIPTKGDLYNHRYCRSYPAFCLPTLKKYWKTVI